MVYRRRLRGVPVRRRSITNAHWPANQSWSDLSDHYFSPSGKTCQNTNANWNAGAMACRYANKCTTCTGAGHTVNDDWEYNAEVGECIGPWTWSLSGPIKLS
ncbi:hypothetical protein GCM10029978_064830 [Actinoallomurus acanthiterrae]